MKSEWVAKVIELDGELALEFPDDLLDAMGWKTGDTLCWEQNGDEWILSKVDDNESEVSG